MGDLNVCGKCTACKTATGYCEEVYDNGNECYSNGEKDSRSSLIMPSSSSLSSTNNGNIQIAKQASKIWREHFVTCQICTNAYSKMSSSVEYCVECKCHVCTNCNCKVFHLSYQGSLWEESKEEKVSKAKKKKEKEKSETVNSGEVSIDKAKLKPIETEKK